MSRNPSQSQSAKTSSPELSWEALDRQDWHLWLLAVVLIFVLGGGLLSFMFPAVYWMKEGVAVQTQQRALFGFGALLVLTQVYLLQKQAMLRRLKRELVEAQAALTRADQEAAIQSFQTLSGTTQFHDALAMEFRRASTSGDHLAVVLFSAPAASSEILGRMSQLLYAMLREGETVYRISDEAVSIILPGMRLTTAASFAAQVEDLNAIPKQGLEVHITAFPDEVSSLAELQAKLRKWNSRMDRRKHFRYPVSGSLVMDCGSQHYSGVPLDLSLGGILFRADPSPPVGTAGNLQLNVAGFDESIQAEAQIIRSSETLRSAIFPVAPAALQRCVEWLARKESDKST